MWSMGQDTFCIQLAYFEENHQICLIIRWLLSIFQNNIRMEEREMSGSASFIIFQVQFKIVKRLAETLSLSEDKI